MTAPAPLGRLADVIRAVAPRADAVLWSAALAAPMRSSGITTARRVAMFVSQIAVESAGFAALSENLNYTTAARLCAVWPSRFPTLAAAEPFVSEPERLACSVYADRLGNGPEESGDGWTFRGAGLIQLTGRTNHAAFALASRRAPADCAAWVRTPDGAAASACWFWSRNGLNALADTGNVEAVTRRVNGGTGGLAERQAAYTAAARVLA